MTGLVTFNDGQVFDPAAGHRQLPDKQWRRHRWVAIVTYSLSDEQAETVSTPGAEMLLDGSNLWSFNIGCIDCEQPYATANPRCPEAGYVDPRRRRS